MKRTFWIFLASLLVLTALDMSGQRWKLRRYEMDIYLAGVSFHGDIGLADRPLANMVNGFRPSVGITPRFYIQENLAVNLDLAYLVYGGKDDENSTHARVYSFNSHAFQHLARMEFYILGPGGFPGASTAIYNRRGMVNNYNRMMIYIFGGAGGILSKAKVKDLNADGQEPLWNSGYDNGLKYTAAFPVGGGLKFSFDPRWSLAVELGYQFTLSDYLDGYKTRFSNYNDSYYLTSVKMVYKIRNDRNLRPIFNKYYR